MIFVIVTAERRLRLCRMNKENRQPSWNVLTGARIYSCFSLILYFLLISSYVG